MPEHYSDRSNDRRYFSIVPRIVWAMSRTAYDLALWVVIKDVCGEDGECYLTTTQLATLSMMSEGQVSDSREHLLKSGLLEGEKKVSSNNQPLWHIRIPDLWEWNIRWAETHKPFASRMDWKTYQGQSKSIVEERICRRCHQSFIGTGRRDRRCASCQDEVNYEKNKIHNWIRKPQKKFISEQQEQKCSACGAEENLELHMDDNSFTQIICVDCHDLLHGESLRIHSIEPYSTDTLHESVAPIRESVSSFRESKKIDIEDKKEEGVELWKDLWLELRLVLGTRWKLWESGVVDVVMRGDEVEVRILNADMYDWLERNKKMLDRMLVERHPTAHLFFKHLEY